MNLRDWVRVGMTLALLTCSVGAFATEGMHSISAWALMILAHNSAMHLKESRHD
jgi:hypothetical protein